MKILWTCGPTDITLRFKNMHMKEWFFILFPFILLSDTYLPQLHIVGQATAWTSLSILQCPWLFKPHRDSLLMHSAAYPFFPHFVLLGSSDYSMSCDSFFHFSFRNPAFSPLPFCRIVWLFLCRQTDVSIASLVYFRIHRAGEAAHSDSPLHLHISISLWFISICTAGVTQRSDDNAP